MKDREYTQKWLIVVHTMMPAAGKLRQTAHHGASLGLLVDSRTAKEGSGEGVVSVP